MTPSGAAMASSNKAGTIAVAAVMLIAGVKGNAGHDVAHAAAAAGHVAHAATQAVSAAVTGGGNLNTRRGWAKRFLAAIPEPVTGRNVCFVVEWELREGGGFGNQAVDNPLNVNPPAGIGWPGYHATGAWAFPNRKTGLDYTVQTIRNGYYSGILAALSRGDDPQGAADALVNSPWAGSHYGWNWTSNC
jgi:hypothetical protein